MRVTVLASVSVGTPWWAEVTRANRVEYCERHGYTMLERQETYETAMGSLDSYCQVLDDCDLLWALDADCLVTDLTKRIEAVACLGPHCTICLEGAVPEVLLNAGSVVWRNTPESRQLLREIAQARAEWATAKYLFQDWLTQHRERLAHCLTVAPERTFNSVWPIWRPGDFVFHACGMTRDDRTKRLRDRLKDVVR